MAGGSYKTITLKADISGIVSAAFGELQTLRDEMSDITDNMSSNNMEHLPKYETADAAHGALDQVADNEPEIPESIGATVIEYTEQTNKRKGRENSRAVRLDNALGGLEAVVQFCDERLDSLAGDIDEREEADDDDAAEEFRTEKDALEEFRDEVQNIIDELQGNVEFPGMYG